MLDFVYQMELLARKTHLILAEKPKCLHIRIITSGIDEVKELLFSLGPLSAYLFRLFSDDHALPSWRGSEKTGNFGSQ